jgi:hypothetical protein
MMCVAVVVVVVVVVKVNMIKTTVATVVDGCNYRARDTRSCGDGGGCGDARVAWWLRRVRDTCT